MSDQTTSEKIDGVKKAADEAAGAVLDFVGKASDRAGNAYGATRELAQSVEPFVKDRPYASVALATLAGFVIGSLFAGHGSKVIYVKPRD